MAMEAVKVSEFQELAKQILPKPFYDFFNGGAEDETTLAQNVHAFTRITLRPRVLVDVSSINLSTNLLGFNMSSPIMVAPTASHNWAHPQAEVATARAAAACGAIMVVSTSSSVSIEEIAASCKDATRFLQLYVFKNREMSAELVRRAEIIGFKAIVLTVDVPRVGKREADIRNNLGIPMLKNFEEYLLPDVANPKGSVFESFGNRNLDSSICWKDVGWLKSVTKLPILIKGVLTAEDALKCVEVGAAGIIVSNHGGRQLDHVPASIDVLEEISKALAGKLPILLDGGIRRGTDVFKALALGAHAVMIGRPVVFALAAMGEYGVKRVIEMLRDELELTMALTGCCSIKEITRAHVHTEYDRLRSML